MKCQYQGCDNEATVMLYEMSDEYVISCCSSCMELRIEEMAKECERECPMCGYVPPTN